MPITKTKGKEARYSAEFAARNITESEVYACMEAVSRRMADQFFRSILQRRLRSPLGTIGKRMAKIEERMRKVAR